MTNAAPTSSLLADLRTATADLHTRAERHPVQAALVQGQADRAAYAAYLSQMYHIHSAVEAELDRRLGAHDLAPVERTQFRAQHALDDLRALGVSAPSPAAEPVRRFAGTLAEATDAELFGMHYVLEGSTNGGRFIAAAVRRSLAIESGQGDSYLDPYGDQQRARWANFCERAGRIDHSEPRAAQSVHGAQRMFTLIIDTFDAIHQRPV